jgi:methylase of polypeptide subunit release factors
MMTSDFDAADAVRQAMYAQLVVQGEDEYVRLRLQHELLTRAMGGQLIRAPMPPAPRILDSATGDGLWMVEALKAHPDATLRGTDLDTKHFQRLQHLPSAISFGT